MSDDDPATGRRFLSLSLLDLEFKRACRDRRGRFAACGSGGGGGGGHAGGGSGGSGGPASPATPGRDIPVHPTRSQINQAVLAASRARTEHYRAATEELRKPAAQMNTARVQALARRADELTVHLARLRAAAEGRPYSANFVPGSRLRRKPGAGGKKDGGVGTDGNESGRPFLMVGLLGLGLDTKKAAARRRGKLTGGRWVTDDDGHHLYIRGGRVVAGRGVQSASGGMHGAQPKPGEGGGGRGGGTTAKPAEAPGSAAKPEPVKPAGKPEQPKPTAAAKPAPKPAEPAPKPAPKPPAQSAGHEAYTDVGQPTTDTQFARLSAVYKEHGRDWSAGLSKGETAAVVAYSGPRGFKTINGRLRAGQDDPRVKALDAAVAKGSLRQDTVLFRGVSDVKAMGLPTGPAAVGTVIRDHAYSSTSMNVNAALGFASGENSAVFRIKAPAGTKAALVSEVGTQKAREYEVLLGRGTGYRITGHRQVGKRMMDVYDVELVD